MPRDEYMTVTKVAELLLDMFGDGCACNYNGIDGYLADEVDCPPRCPTYTAECWEKFVRHWMRRNL